MVNGYSPQKYHKHPDRHCLSRGWIRSLQWRRYRAQFRACSTPTTYSVLPLLLFLLVFTIISVLECVHFVHCVLTVNTVFTVLDPQFSLFCCWCPARPVLTIFWNVHPSPTYNPLPACSAKSSEYVGALLDISNDEQQKTQTLKTFEVINLIRYQV